MFFLAPLGVTLLCSLVPKRMSGLRVVLAAIGLISYLAALTAAFSHGFDYQNQKPNKKRRAPRPVRSFADCPGAARGDTGTTGLPITSEALEEAEEEWDRDSGVI